MNISVLILLYLAHLSRRLIGELIVYPWSGVRRRPSSVRRPSVVHNAQTSSSQKPLGRSKPNFMWSGTKFRSPYPRRLHIKLADQSQKSTNGTNWRTPNGANFHFAYFLTYTGTVEPRLSRTNLVIPGQTGAQP